MLNSPICAAPNETPCVLTECRERCASEVIDELLCEASGVTGEEADLLLDLRSHVRRREDAEGVMRHFCDLRVRLEQRHYLAFFRLRRWLENHLVAAIQICPAAEPHLVSVRLDHYCVEAVRRVCLCTAARDGLMLLAPRLRFAFRQVPSPAKVAERRLEAAIS